MENLDFDKLFEPSNKSVLDFYRQSGVGYYIPDYQRDYSWDKENINQLLSDIAEGVDRLVTIKSTDKEIHFLGTVITVWDKNNKNKDPKGKPTRIDMIIDGQQRIITITLMASVFIKTLAKCLSQIKASSPLYDSVKEIVNTWNTRLMDIISFDLLRGKPHLKPKVIRGGIDYWTADDDIIDAYQSEFAQYQALFINAYDEFINDSNPKFQVKNLSGKYDQNLKRIERWVNNIVGKSHVEATDYPNAQDILKGISEDLLWDYERPTLKDIIKKHFEEEKTKDSDTLCILVQVLAACYYLLQRCCFCVIKPENEDWAFDMFQSLNTTGTSLTALETFKPVVVNYLKIRNIDYNGSISEKYFSQVQRFLDDNNNTVKTKRTNDFIVSFFVAYKGEKVPTHFSGERRALVDSYNNLSTEKEKESFIKMMGDYSQFYNLWLIYDGQKPFQINEFNEETELASMLILFLKNSNHRMAITTLGASYSKVLDNESGAAADFIGIIKATTAFYFLWRSAYSNNGLDIAYRDYFHKRFEANLPITLDSLKEHFIQTLKEKGVTSEEWKRKAAANLKYGKNNNDFVRLALLITATDTVPDPETLGSIMKGKSDTCDYLKLKYWNSNDLKTIEHIAPQTNHGAWDKDLYDPDTMFVDSLGNLTLLPVEINSSLSNKGLQEKLLYYKCVAEESQSEIDDLANMAKLMGITLNGDTIQLLRDSKYAHHIKPISQLNYSDSWKVDLVKHRTNAMLGIIWDKLYSWLQ